MTLNDLQDDYNYFSGELTAQTRYLAYSGIAVIWLFRAEGAAMMFPQKLQCALLLFILTLLLDFLFLAYSTILPGCYMRKKEKECLREGKTLTVDADFGGWSEYLILPKQVLRWLKAAACLSGYILVFWHFCSMLRF